MTDLIIAIQPPWILTPEQIAHVRGRAKTWRVRREAGRRTTTCRECAGPIPSKTIRLAFKHLNWESKTYDKVGYIHDDPTTCVDLKLEIEYMAWQAERVKAYLADPVKFTDAEERRWEEINRIGKKVAVTPGGNNGSKEEQEHDSTKRTDTSDDIRTLGC